MMRRVSLEQFRFFIRDMEHVGFASPDPAHGYFDTREYYEGNGKRAEVRKLDGFEEYFVREVPPENESR
jgi:hypothetical protein